MRVSLGNLTTANREEDLVPVSLILYSNTGITASKQNLGIVFLLLEPRVFFLLSFPILEDAEHLYLTSIRKSWDKVSPEADTTLMTALLWLQLDYITSSGSFQLELFYSLVSFHVCKGIPQAMYKRQIKWISTRFSSNS